ncbi:MAG: pimeloyl-ACP methyl ester carboxylesterase [Cognaticolwellia sp.]
MSPIGPTEAMVPGFGGLQLCLRSHDGPAHTPLLILHGFQDQSASWDACVEVLCANGPVLVPDQRGFGLSEHVGRGGTYHFSDYVLDIDTLLQDQDLEAVHVVGHSMGATVACYLAAARPDLVRTLSLVDGIGPPEVPDTKAPEQLRIHLRHHRRPRGHSPMASLGDAAARLRKATPSLSIERALALAERGTRSTPQGWVWRWDAKHRARSALPFDADRFVAHLQEVQCPTQLVLGAQGWFRHLPDLDRRVQALRARQISIEGGHNLHLDNPQGLAKVLGDWIRTQSPRAAIQS